MKKGQKVGESLGVKLTLKVIKKKHKILGWCCAQWIQWIKLLPVTLVSCVGFLSVLLLIQVPANVTGKTVELDPNMPTCIRPGWSSWLFISA